MSAMQGGAPAGGGVMSEAEVAMLKGMVESTLKLEHPMFQLLQKRVLEVLRHWLRAYWAAADDDDAGQVTAQRPAGAKQSCSGAQAAASAAATLQKQARVDAAAVTLYEDSVRRYGLGALSSDLEAIGRELRRVATHNASVHYPRLYRAILHPAD